MASSQSSSPGPVGLARHVRVGERRAVYCRPMTVWKPGAFAGQTVSREIAGALLSEVKHTRALKRRCARARGAVLQPAARRLVLRRRQRFRGSLRTVTPSVFHDALSGAWDAIAAGGCRMFFVELLSPWVDVVTVVRRPAHLFEMDGPRRRGLILRLHREFCAGNAASALTVRVAALRSSARTFRMRASTRPGTRLDCAYRGSSFVRASLPGPICERSRQQIGVNPSHLCRTFRRFRRRTIGDFRHGLTRAARLPEAHRNADSLTDVAAEAGFTDQST